MAAPQTGYSVASLLDLKAIAPEDRTDRFMLMVGEKNAIYAFSSTSALTANENSIVDPDSGTGQWLMLTASAAGGTVAGLPLQIIQDWLSDSVSATADFFGQMAIVIANDGVDIWVWCGSDRGWKRIFREQTSAGS